MQRDSSVYELVSAAELVRNLLSQGGAKVVEAFILLSAFSTTCPLEQITSARREEVDLEKGLFCGYPIAKGFMEPLKWLDKELGPRRDFFVATSSVDPSASERLRAILVRRLTFIMDLSEVTALFTPQFSELGSEFLDQVTAGFLKDVFVDPV